MLSAELIINTMNYIGYDVINLGETYLLYGNRLSVFINSAAKFPVVNANIESRNLLWKPYLIKDIKGVKIAVTGIVMPDEKVIKSYEKILSPVDTLRRLVPELKKEADMIILLSRLNYHETIDLIKEIPDIHIAVVGQGIRSEAVKIGNTLIAGHGRMGESVGVMEIEWDKKEKKIAQFQGYIRDLDDKIKYDTSVNDMIIKYTEVINSSKKSEEKEELSSDDKKLKVEELKKMTPEEFMKAYNKAAKKAGEE